MKITKLGHCCLLIETKGKRILTDPGSYTVETHSKLTDIDYILFTHEHQDHFHLDSLKVILQYNPYAVVYANNSVSELLNASEVKHIQINHNESLSLDTVQVLGFGEKHAQMHSSIPRSSNIGFFIDNRLWYPGDALTDFKEKVEILALPVTGPWIKIGEAIDYALALKPKITFPVHDGQRLNSSHSLPARVLSAQNLEFFPMVEGEVREF